MVRGLTDLTPIEEHNGILFKRDDLFMPFEDIPLSGGKVRQCMNLLQNNRELIAEKFGNCVSTVTSVDSPQGVIVASIANSMGFDTIIGVGGKVDFDKHPTLKYCEKKFGTELKILSGIAYNSTLFKKLQEYQAVKNNYIVRFGINLEADSEAILGSISNQCENLPDDLDTLIIPCGSAITFSGILLGLRKFRKKPKKVIGIQIAGVDRRKGIENILSLNLSFLDVAKIKYEFLKDKTYPYSKKVEAKVSGDFQLDYIYEAKAYEYAVKNNLFQGKSLYWVVGNAIPVKQFCEREIKQ